MKILVVRLDHLGDLVLTTPLIRALALAGNKVDILARDAIKTIFDHSPYVQNSYAIERVSPCFPLKWWTLGRWMRQHKYDTIILAYAKQKQLCFASAMSGAKRRVAMWAGVWGRLTLHRCLASHMLTNPRPVSDILLDCSRALGVADQGLNPDIFLDQRERTAFHAMVPAGCRERKLIGIHPGAAGNACNLPCNVYAAVADQLLKRSDCAIIVTGTKAERSLLHDWPETVSKSDRVWLAVGEFSLRELACAIADMSVFVCSSTGPLHVASAVHTPTVSPFCPTVPLSAVIWGNQGAPSRVLEPEFCPLHTRAASCCDFNGQITPEQMVNNVLSLMQDTAPKMPS